MTKLTLIGLALAGALCAQEKITMPFSNPSAPRKLNVDLLVGSVTVKGYAGQEAVIEYSSSGPGPAVLNRKGTPEPPPPGMHRIGGSRSPDITEENNTITVRSGIGPPVGDVTIQVPVDTSVTVKTLAGKNVTIDNINGEIEANNTNGEVNITNASGSVVAHSMNGKVVVSLNKVTPGKNMSFSTMNGTIDVTLPADTKANLKMRADNGEIYTDFDVKLEPQSAPHVQEDKNKSGKTRRRTIREGSQEGAINGGGAEMQFTTFNGRILIHKK